MESNIQENIKISICCLAYNHAPYIRECLDSFLMQETDFDFEILIHDDASVDNTAQIIREYEKQYPEIIKPIYQNENKFSKEGGGMNIRYNFPRSSGKYIALCEGDDYWTDPFKLQKLVEYLEEFKDINICFHRVNLLNDDLLVSHPVPKKFQEIPFNYIELLRSYNFIGTCSVVFRKPENFDFPSWIIKSPIGDLALYKLISQDKKLVCINEFMGVYRIHKGGVWSGLNELETNIILLNFYKIILPHLNKEEKKVAWRKASNIISQLTKHKYPTNKMIQKLHFQYLKFSLWKLI